MALVTAGCSVGQAHPGSHVPIRAIGANTASAVTGVSCQATTARATGPLPADFRPVAVVRCYQIARGITGHGLWTFDVKQRADHGLGKFIAALRRPSVKTPANAMCPAIGYLDPSFVLTDRRGRVIRPALPVAECGQPLPAAITALRHLPSVTVAVRRTVQIATRAELVAGCDSQWKDVMKMGNLDPSAGGPAFSPRPPRLRICIYQDPSHNFLRGGFISQAAESKLLGDIQGGLVGTVSRAGLAIIGQAGRP